MLNPRNDLAVSSLPLDVLQRTSVTISYHDELQAHGIPSSLNIGYIQYLAAAQSRKNANTGTMNGHQSVASIFRPVKKDIVERQELARAQDYLRIRAPVPDHCTTLHALGTTKTANLYFLFLLSNNVWIVTRDDGGDPPSSSLHRTYLGIREVVHHVAHDA